MAEISSIDGASRSLFTKLHASTENAFNWTRSPAVQRPDHAQAPHIVLYLGLDFTVSFLNLTLRSADLTSTSSVVCPSVTYYGLFC